MHYSIIAQVVGAMGASLPQQKFMVELLTNWLAGRGRFNYVNISRYGGLHERTLRRWFGRDFAWAEFNQRLVACVVPPGHELIAAMDASFVPKSGKRTVGLGWFFNGCAGRAEKGLEVSLVSVVDVTRNTAYALSARQTMPAAAAGGEGDGEREPPATACQHSRDRKSQPKRAKGKHPYPAKGKRAKGKRPQAPLPAQETRIDAYLEHVRAVCHLLPRAVRHLAVDGYFTNYKFVQGVSELGLELVGKLRHDANLRYLYRGPQAGRGRPRLYDGKVQWGQLDLRRWHSEGEIEPGVHLYSASLYHVSLKRVLRVALLQERQRGQRAKSVLLFSTDLELKGRAIVRYYKARFQIEFLFRDAKGATGLSDCQARTASALHCHWNAALCALNLAKWQESQRAVTPVFSVASCKQRSSNQRLLQVFSERLGLDWSALKSHHAYADLCNYGAIRP